MNLRAEKMGMLTGTSEQPYQEGDSVRMRKHPGIVATIVDGPINDAGDMLYRVRVPDGLRQELARGWQANGALKIAVDNG